MSHGADSLKSIFYALGANFAIAVAKLVAAILTGSGSMTAEAIHSFADCSNQLLLLLGIRLSKRPPSPDFPLGYGKSVYFWSFIVALILFSMGGLYSIYEGWHKLHQGEMMSYAGLAVGVLIFAIIAESISMWGCMREVNKEKAGRSISQWFRETRKSELLVIFGEDAAALLGLSIALIAVILTLVTGNPLYDALGSMFIGFLLVIIAILIGVEVKALLIGQGVEKSVRTAMIEFLEQREEIEQVFNLLTLQLGIDVMVAVKVKITGVDTVQDLVQAINRCEKEFKQAFPNVLWSFFEPDKED
ncbi:cation diffusion facilitator family transporter [candidate division CSSED10-310 bacterium]|uniref:Cation diffusion facilitator family transporter n=1 Tax=candidate division CSSED10-310 bacterium TaxID=2855610 RepID=A0ABV6YTP6_UNCC1